MGSNLSVTGRLGVGIPSCEKSVDVRNCKRNEAQHTDEAEELPSRHDNLFSYTALTNPSNRSFETCVEHRGIISVAFLRHEALLDDARGSMFVRGSYGRRHAR